MAISSGARSPLSSGTFWAKLGLDRSQGDALQRQLYEQIRKGIEDGSLAPATRLPASRRLALEIGCSRNTVVEVVARLVAEGYLASVRGSGVFVERYVPDDARAEPASIARLAAGEGEAGQLPDLSARGEAIAETRLQRGPVHVAFMPSLPDVSLFPIDTWIDLNRREWRAHGRELVMETNARGFAPLREAIAHYVGASRSIVCDPDQVIVTSGAQQGIDLVARVLLDPGDHAWVEDPGYPAVRALLSMADATIVPKPVDAQGIVLAASPNDVAPRVIAVSPSNQFPTGVMMTLERRVALLEYAQRVGAWILEDDYDSEFRYEERPLSALAGLGEVASERVIYVGTFSKMLFPAIRLGYLIVPKRVSLRFARARRIVDLQPSIVAQPALARFIADGHLATHLRRMRLVYRRRRDALLEALRAQASSLVTCGAHGAGMQLVAHFTPELEARYDDVTAARLATERRLNVQPFSSYFERHAGANGFVLGYACVDEAALARATTTLVEALA